MSLILNMDDLQFCRISMPLTATEQSDAKMKMLVGG